LDLFFCQAEDGIRARNVTGVQTCALPISRPAHVTRVESAGEQLSVTATGPDTASATTTTDILLSATGTWNNPHVPHIPGIETFCGHQLHTKDYTRKEDFAGLRTLVVGGGLSAVQFPLELQGVTETIWATRRPPNFTSREFDATWGLEVEQSIRERTSHGQAPASVVRTTSIPQVERYLQGVADGVLVSRGMFDRVTPAGVVFGSPLATTTGGVGPAAHDELQVPESWDPYPPGTEVDADVIFWNTGFRHSLRHLAPLKLRADRKSTRLNSSHA